MTIRNLEALLMPASVALIGASAREGSIGQTVTRNMLLGGFKGPIGLVNPRRVEIAGHPCHATIGALPFTPDLAVVATPPATVPEVVAQLAAKGTRAVVVITAGLDAATTQRTLEAGRARLVRVLGPNTIGVMLPRIMLNASFAHRAPLQGDLAVLSQSGALVTAIVDWAAAREIGFSHVLSLGDMSDVDFGDLLDWLAADNGTRAILMYMEAVTEAPKFMSAARRAARVKPVVVVKSGRHAVGARAAASHTGRLAGADSAYDAAFRRAGIVRVLDLDELFEAAETLTRVARLRSERLFILTNGGGAGVLAADRLADFGVELAPLAETTRQRLDGVLPPTWSKANPVDIIGDAGPERYEAALSALLEDPDPAAILIINCPTALASSSEVAHRVIEVVERAERTRPLIRRPVITNWLGDGAAAEARHAFQAAGIATFDTPAAAARGFAQVVRYYRAQAQLMAAPPAMDRTVPVDRAAARAVIAAARRDGRTSLSEVEGKRLIAAYAIATVPTRAASTLEEVASIAAEIVAQGATVALKVLSAAISHKSDVGGVRLDLQTPQDAVREAGDMIARIRRLRPDVETLAFTLSPMIRRKGAHELILGASVDPNFGPLILFGSGGVAVETVADTALALPPLDLGLARRLMDETRVIRLLRGYRDRPAADLGAIATALVRLSQLVAENPEIAELDINPLLADADGIIALDARVRLLAADAPARTPMAIRPYPVEIERSEHLPGIGRLLLRPIMPEDERFYADFIAAVEPNDMRLRFFAPAKSLSRELIARLTQIDYAREMALVALSEDGRSLLGVARYGADPDLERAEYAILLRSDLKGRGLGWLLMQRLIEVARKAGIGTLTGSVLAENTTMLRMCGELGFAIQPDPDDPSMRTVSLPLRSGSGR